MTENRKWWIMWFQYIIRLLFVLVIMVAGVGIMFSSIVLSKSIEEKAAFALIGLFITGISFLFLYLNKDVLNLLDTAYWVAIMQETIFAVEWDGGRITGFSSKREAERYIKCVCKKAAGNHKYSVYSYYRLSTKKSKWMIFKNSKNNI